MLAKHDRKSRTRITAGVTGAAALTLAGLAFTASGTQAAANLRADVGNVIGVDLQEAPAAPAAPEAPAAAEAADAPEAPVAPAAKDEAKRVKKIRIVTHDKDGKITVTEDGDFDAVHVRHKKLVIKDGKVVNGYGMPDDLPVVLSTRCGAPKDGELKIESKDGKRRTITICTDRIEMRAEAAAARAIAAEAIADRAHAVAIARVDTGKRHAMFGLKMARKSIEAQHDLTDAQRAAALKGIDEAIREIGNADKD